MPPGRCWIIRLGCALVIGAGPAALRALACSAGSGAPCAARLPWQSRQLLPGPRKPPPLPSPLCGCGRGAGAARLPLAPLRGVGAFSGMRAAPWSRGGSRPAPPPTASPAALFRAGPPCAAGRAARPLRSPLAPPRRLAPSLRVLVAPSSGLLRFAPRSPFGSAPSPLRSPPPGLWGRCAARGPLRGPCSLRSAAYGVARRPGGGAAGPPLLAPRLRRGPVAPLRRRGARPASGGPFFAPPPPGGNFLKVCLASLGSPRPAPRGAPTQGRRSRAQSARCIQRKKGDTPRSNVEDKTNRQATNHIIIHTVRKPKLNKTNIFCLISYSKMNKRGEIITKHRFV